MAYVKCDVCGGRYPVGTISCSTDGNPLIGQPPVQDGALDPERQATGFRLLGSGLAVAVERELRIGRDPAWSPLGSELRDHDVVSARHATVWVDNGRLMIRDEGSTNGTSIDDRPCEPHQHYEVPAGARLRLSSALVLTVEIGGSSS